MLDVTDTALCGSTDSGGNVDGEEVWRLLGKMISVPQFGKFVLIFAAGVVGRWQE